MMMAKGKLIALAGAALAVLLVSSAAQADPADITVRAGGVLIDGTGAAAGSANVLVTLPDDGDPMTPLVPVPGVDIEYWIGESQVPCDPDIARTDPSGVARCGLLGHLDALLANGGHYEARFAGNEMYAAKSDGGSLIWNANTGDLP